MNDFEDDQEDRRSGEDVDPSAGAAQGSHDRGDDHRESDPRPSAGWRNPADLAVNDETPSVHVERYRNALNHMFGARIGLNRGWRAGAHPVGAMVVPTNSISARGANPLRLRVRVSPSRYGVRGVARPIEVHGRRSPILEDASSVDPEVWLSVVATHDDASCGGVRELQPVAEVDRTHCDAVETPRDRDRRDVVGRSYAAHAVGARRGGQQHHEADGEDCDDAQAHRRGPCWTRQRLGRRPRRSRVGGRQVKAVRSVHSTPPYDDTL